MTPPGWAIVLATSFLVLVGIACILVTDTHYSSGHDGAANAAKQAIRVLAGMVAGIVILRIGYQRFAEHSYAFFVLALALLIPLLLARIFHTSFGGLTAPRNGAYRWIHLPGFLLQPSEFMKLAYVLALAWYLRYRKNYRRLGGLMIPVIFSAIPFGLILLEPDLGTALLLCPVLLITLFAAGSKIRHLLLIVLVAMAMAPLAWGQIQGYQRARVTSVLLQSDALRQKIIAHPENFTFLASEPKVVKRQAMEWAASSGFQLVHSKNAIGSGGLFGHGWGNGVYVESSLLPDRHNDFIFALIGHQWGFVGCVIVLCCYAIIVLAGVRIASATTDPMGRLLAVGIVALIVTQVVINVGITIGLLPITGTTLPFVSYGGSSLLTSFMALALLISVSQRRPFLLSTRPFEFHRESRGKKPLADYEQTEASDPGN